MIDVTFYFSRQFGDVSVKLCRIVFDDGTSWDIEGEHDFPYVTDTIEFPMPDEEILNQLYKEQDA